MINVIPLPRQIGADVRLILMVAANDFDFQTVSRGVEILNRQFRGRDRTYAADVGIEARHIGQHADFYRHFILRMRGGCRAGEDSDCERQSGCEPH